MTIWNIDFSDIDWEYCDPEPADQPVIDALHQLRTVDADYPPDLLAARRDEILKTYNQLTPEEQRNVREELAEIQTTLERE